MGGQQSTNDRGVSTGNYENLAASFPYNEKESVLKIVKFSLLGACQQENIQMLCQVAKIHIWEQALNIDFVSGIIQQY